MLDIGFGIIVACAAVMTVLCFIAFVRWNKDMDEWEYAIQTLSDVTIFLDDIRRALGIEINEPDNPEVTD